MTTPLADLKLIQKMQDMDRRVSFLERLETPTIADETNTYAEIYLHDANVAQSIPTGATYTKSTAWTTNGESNNATPDATNDQIVLTETGVYYVSCSNSVKSGKANVNFLAAIFVNGVEQDQIHWRRLISTAGDEGVAAMSGYIAVYSENTQVDVRFRHDDGGAVDLTLTYSNLSCLRVDDVTIPELTTFTRLVTNNADDGIAIGGGGFTVNQNFIRIGKAINNYERSFLRFTNVNIPNGATIVTANLTLKSFSAQAGITLNEQIYMNAIDDAVAPLNYAGTIALALTTNFTVWDDVAAWANSETIVTPDFSGALQEIVSRGGWAALQAMQVLMLDNGSDGNAYREFVAHNSDPANAALLTVQYFP